MGRRSRQVQERRQEREETRAVRDRMTRVQVSDETWAAYRVALGTTPVSVALGQLVEREVLATAAGQRSMLTGSATRSAMLAQSPASLSI